MPDTMGVDRLPRSILVVSHEQYLRFAQSPENVGLVDDLDAMVVPYSGRPQVNEAAVSHARDRLRAAGQLVPGSLLIKNPYDAESFEFAESAIEAFASAKYSALANVARLLGAREVHFKEAKVETRRRNRALGLDVIFKFGGGDFDASQDVKDQLKAQLTGQMFFPGSDPDLEAARNYLKLRNLTTDQQVKDLIELRSGENRITRQLVKISGTRESESNFRSALNLANAGPVKVLKIGATFTQTATTIRNIEISTEIIF